MSSLHPLVVLPGMNCSAKVWQPALEFAALGALHLDVRQPSLRGRSLDDCVDRLLAHLPPRFSLAGLSLGAIVGLALARSAPERVDRLALFAVNPRPPRPDQQQTWAAQRGLLTQGGTPRSLQESLLPMLLSAHRRADLDGVVLAMADEVGAAALDEQLAIQQTRIDERPALSGLAVPTLVVAGADDALVSVEQHEEVCAAVLGARLEVLAHTGHLSTLESPALVGSLLGRWLAD